MIVRDQLKVSLEATPQTVAETGMGWTMAVKTALCELGHSHGRYVSASGVHSECARNGEWLFDVTWSDYSYGKDEARTDWRLKSLSLIAESEWGNDGDLLDDFEKLLIARATEKLFVCHASTQQRFAERKAMLKSAKDAFGESVHDRIYLACYLENLETDYGWELKFDDL